MMCKSIINYKYSIASLQSATEIGADNLQKTEKGLFSLKPCMCVYACVCACVSVVRTSGIKATAVGLCAFGCLAQSVKLSQVKSRSDTNIVSNCDIMKIQHDVWV